MQVKIQQLELAMEQPTGSKLGKEYIKAVYCHPAYFTYICLFSIYFTYMLITYHVKWQARIKTAGRNISNLRYADDITLMAESEEELKSLLIRMK